MAQVKSKQRVADHGEVFTAEREVKAMCDLVAHDCSNIFSRFLEPACGDGNFLVEILARKLVVVKERYRKSSYDWERYSLLAIGSLYGVDILADNCVACRERLFDIWNKEYKKVCRKDCNDDTRNAAKFILERNIVCGNALTLSCVDENQQDNGIPIVFSEWTFPKNDAYIRRDDYTFDFMLNGPTLEGKPTQASLFEEDEAPVQTSLFDGEPSENDGEGRFIQRYSCHYRKLSAQEAI